MKTKLYSLLLFFFMLGLLGGQVYGQLEPSAWSGTYMTVNSYNGSTFPGSYTLRIGYQGVNILNWALLVRVNGPIKNSEGKIIPPEKVRIKINTISGSPAPTFGQLGIPNNPLPLNLVDQAIIPKSNWALNASKDTNKSITFTFDIIIAEGDYLQALKPNNPHDKPYPLNLVFSIKEGNRSWYESAPIGSTIVINPTGNPPVTPTYSIQVNSNASNGLLEFKSISDYVNGVSQTYDNGLSVVSNTSYDLQVKAQSTAFESLNSSIPLNTVSLNLKVADNNFITPTVQLSNSVQTIASSGPINVTQTRAFDIRYFTDGSNIDDRLQKAKPDTYKTTLIYTLIPR